MNWVSVVGRLAFALAVYDNDSVLHNLTSKKPKQCKIIILMNKIQVVSNSLNLVTHDYLYCRKVISGTNMSRL